MLNLNCAICSEMYTAADDVHATICGHMFHVNCLSQWFQRSKTCPQCRNKCSDRSVIRIYFNNSNLDCTRVDVASLQEQLSSAQAQLIVKKNELQKAEDEIKKSKETQKKCMKTIAGLEQDLKSKSFLILNYAEKTKMLESQLKFMDNVRKEVKDLREKIKAMENVNSLLASSMSEAEKLLKNESDPKILSVWVATLKRELKVCENRKADMRNVLKMVQSDLRREIDLKKSQEDKISQLESENYQLLQKIKSLEGGHMRNNHNNHNNNFEVPRRKSLDLNNALVGTPRIKQEQNSIISPTLQQNIRTIEESVSPYLNIRSCNVLLPPLLMRNHENRINNNIKPLGSKVTVLKVSPTKTGTGTIRKSNSDLKQFKKLCMDLRTGPSGPMKPLPPNYVFNGYGGSERVDPFERCSHSDDEIQIKTEAKKHTGVKNRPAPANSIRNRLKSGGLRDIKLAK